MTATAAGRTSTAQPPARDPSAWWNRDAVLALALTLTALPLLWPPIPPLIDLPSHLGAYHIGAALDGSASLRRYYDFHWEVLGNLGAELLVIPLAKAIGVELATKLVVILTVVASVAGMLWVAREVHGELPPTAGFALPLAYCYPLLYGFLNYCLSMALMLLAFGLWLRLGRLGRTGLRAVLFAPIALVLWFTHAVGWGLLVIACSSEELHRRRRQGKTWRAAMSGSALACASMGLPLFVMVAQPHHGPTAITGWLQPSELAKWLVTLFRDRWITLDLACTVLVAALLGLATAGRLGLRLRARLAWPALALLALFVLAPQSIDDSGFVNGRIAPYAIALLLLAIGTPGASLARQRAMAFAAGAFFVVRIAATTASMVLYSASWTADLQALDHIEPGSAIVALSPVPCGHRLSNWRTPRVYHLPSLAIVRKDAFANTEWQIDGLQLVRATYAAARPFDADPSQSVSLDCDVHGYKRYRAALAEFPRAAFDYLWLLDVPHAAWPQEPDLTLVWSHGESALYRVAHERASTASRGRP